MKKLWKKIADNPKTSLAGAVMILGALFPEHMDAIAKAAGGVGLLLAADSKKTKPAEPAETK